MDRRVASLLVMTNKVQCLHGTAAPLWGLAVSILKNTYSIEIARKVGLRPELKAAATYDFAQDNEDRIAMLPDETVYSVKGKPLEKFGVEAGADLFMTFGNSSEINLTYEGRFRKNFQDHTAMLSFKVNF